MPFYVRIIQGTRTLSSPFSASVLTIGNFDGVHLGHQALIRRVVERAKARGIPAVVLTFEPHPVKVLYPDRQLRRIFDQDDLRERLESLGVEALVIEPFSREFSQLSPEHFLLEWVFKPFVPQEIIVGYDFSFGANRKGSIEFLKERAETLGVGVEVIPPLKVGDIVVSSSRIRQAIEGGEVELANQLLGRTFYIRGLVEKGAGRGRTIGVPTANVRTTAETIPTRGVYAAYVEVRGRVWDAAVNIGYNPTFTNTEGAMPSIEAHLIDFPKRGESADLYGETLRIEFIARLREEKKFASVDALVAQIKSDIAEARRMLAPGGDLK